MAELVGADVEREQLVAGVHPPFLVRTVAAHLHAFGFLIALICGIYIGIQQNTPDMEHTIAIAVYTLTGCFVFAVSSIYHYLHDGHGISDQAADRLEILDHASIYLFVAGSYHAIVTGLIAESWRYEVIGLVWGLAAAGLLYTTFGKLLPAWARSRFIYTSLFILMGWSFLIKGTAMIAAFSYPQLTLLMAGGGFYTAGAVVYAYKRPNPFPPILGYHELWHLAVLAGWFFHMCLVANLYS